jgi:hypothetical protein
VRERKLVNKLWLTRVLNLTKQVNVNPGQQLNSDESKPSTSISEKRKLVPVDGENDSDYLFQPKHMQLFSE